MSEHRQILERHKRFSDSILWGLQREYFDREGVNAWVKQVPFYVTSNPYIAHCYAYIAISFIRDWLSKHPDSSEHPFYLMELGTGSGMFSFHVVKKLYELKQQLHMADIKTVYVMSDFTSNNLDYWRKHPALQFYIQNGQLDFALYNLEDGFDIHLDHSNALLSSEQLKNPLIVCGNYIFDTVSHDAFTMKDGLLHESLVTLETSQENMANDKPVDWDKVDILHEARAIDPRHYYEDEDFNQVLQSYVGRLFNTHFLIPIAGLRAIRQLAKLSAGRLLLISSDKAYSHIDELEGLSHPSLAFHGSFSMMVNYDAIAEYFRSREGDAFLQSQRKGLKSNAFCLGVTFDELPETTAALDHYFEGVSPADYFVYHRHISDTFTTLDVDILASHLNFSRWDPYMFHRLAPRINETINHAAAVTREYLIDGMSKIESNFYYMPASHDTLFDIGIFYHTIKEYRLALSYYQKSEFLFGEQFNVLFNKALCYYYLGENREALTLFKAAQVLDPDSTQVKEWIHFIESSDPKQL